MRPHDVTLIELRPEQSEQQKYLSLTYGQRLLADGLECRTWIKDNRVLAIWGLWPLWDGVSDCWMLSSKHLEPSLSMIKDMKRTLNTMPGRIQTTCLPSFVQGCAFLEFLGFEPEGIMKRYDLLGRDVIRYARIKI